MGIFHYHIDNLLLTKDFCELINIPYENLYLGVYVPLLICLPLLP